MRGWSAPEAPPCRSARTIPRDRTTPQIEDSCTQLCDVRTAVPMLFVRGFFVHSHCRYTRHANATLAVVPHHGHQQRERRQHAGAQHEYNEYSGGLADRARHMHAHTRATRARYNRPDRTDSRQRRSPDADAPEGPHGPPGPPTRPRSRPSCTQLRCPPTGLSSTARVRLLREEGGTGGGQCGIIKNWVRRTSLKNVEVPEIRE